MQIKGPFRCLVIGVILLLGACTTSPTGRQQLILVSPQQVQAMGLASFQQMREQGRFAQAPKKQALARCVVNQLTAVLPSPWNQKHWDVEIIDSKAPNAFALPGGHIGVNVGMFKVADNPTLLAVVLGHELAHVVAHHGAERVSDHMAVQVGMAAATAYSASQDMNVQMVQSLFGVATQLGVLLPFSRAQESEADILGQRYMARAGFDPRAAPKLWQRMQQVAGGTSVSFLSTHPAPDQRMENLAKRAKKLMPTYRKAKATGQQSNCQLASQVAS